MSLLTLIGWFAFVLSLIGGAFWLGGCAAPVVVPVPEPASGFALALATGSMEPVIGKFDLLKIDGPDVRPWDSLVEGEIVSILNGPNPQIAHRLVYKGKAGVGSTFWVTKGDANNRRDSRMLTEELYTGVVTVHKKAPTISP